MIEKPIGEPSLSTVFLSHNTLDKVEVEILARQLQEQGVRLWFDKWDLPFGKLTAKEIGEVLAQSWAVLVCIGRHGIGKFMQAEIDSALGAAFRDSSRKVIPILLSSTKRR